MKKISLIILAILSIGLWSCDEAIESRPIIEEQTKAILDAPFTGTYVLTPENAANMIETYTWGSATYSDAVVPNYTLEIDISGNAFANPQDLGTTSDNKVTVIVETLNDIALLLGLIPFEEGLLDIRLKTQLGSSDATYSEEVYTLRVTPYTTETPRLWAPGGYQAASGYINDWSPADAPTLASEGFGNTNFEGFIYFAADAEFKLTDADNWDNGIFGLESEGVLTSPGDNITVTAGYYRMDVDTEALTYAFTPTQWGLIGNSTPTGWDSDTDMVYDPVAKIWSLTIDLVQQAAPDNGIKFRANDGWDLNIGDSDADGTMEFGGDNIGIAEDGNYTITLDLSNPRAYTYSVTKN